MRSGPLGDRSTCSTIRSAVAGSMAAGRRQGHSRVRAYREDADVLAAARWQANEPTPWIGADRLDPIRDDLKTPCQLYNLDCVAYESLLIGLFDIWRGQPTNRAKPNEVCVGFSRDGFHWDRPSRRAFCPVSERHGDWNWGNVQSAGGCCLVVGDQLYFYVSGRAGIMGSTQSGVCTTGLAVLRRDGFASMEGGKEAGTLTTRPLTFRGRHLFVNADCPRGELLVEMLDRQGNVVAPFTRANCTPIRADGTRQRVRWKAPMIWRNCGAADEVSLSSHEWQALFILDQPRDERRATATSRRAGRDSRGRQTPSAGRDSQSSLFSAFFSNSAFQNGRKPLILKRRERRVRGGIFGWRRFSGSRSSQSAGGLFEIVPRPDRMPSGIPRTLSSESACRSAALCVRDERVEAAPQGSDCQYGPMSG